jgi:hypothetical protein
MKTPKETNMKPVIIYTMPIGGKCPVQAEGTINGLPFYFRSRYGHWSLSISPRADGDPLDKDAWRHREEYDGVERDEPKEVYPGRFMQFGAGWAGEHECAAFIEKAAAALCEAHSIPLQPNTPVNTPPARDE